MEERPASFATIPDLIAAAEAKLPAHLWDFSAGGAGGGASIRIARDAIEACTFRPRVLRDVSTRSTGATLLGHQLALPVFLAPIGSIARFDPAGAVSVARAARVKKTAAFIGGLSLPPLEEAMTAGQAPLFFQVYVGGDRGWLGKLVRRVEEAGYSGICMTVDSNAHAFRDRDRRNRWEPLAVDDHPNLMGAGNDDISYWQPRLTWSDIAWLREFSELPLILKGVLTPEDAVRAVDSGIDVVYVSNHGGLELDYAPAPLTVLPTIVEAVAGGAEVIVDGGFLRGTDILKAKALGADAVGIGKLLCWAAAVGGAAGIGQALDLLGEEMDATMAMIGIARLADLGPEHVST